MAKQQRNMPAGRSESSVAHTTRGIKKKRSFGDKFIAMAKHIFTQFGTAIIAVAIVAYVFLQLMLNVGTILDTESASYVNISDRAEIEAFVFRDEQVIPAAASGTNCFLAEDGEKVRKGENIAITYSNPNDVKIQQRIKEIDARISVLEQSSLSTGASTTNISMLDTQINELMLSIIRQADANEFDKILREKEELLILMNRRQAIIENSSYEDELNALTHEKAGLNASLTGASLVTTSPESGYFYSTVDGYENSFTLERLENLTAEEFETLSNAVPDQSAINRSAGKIVLGSNWYIAVALDKRTAEGFYDGETYPVIFQYSNNAEIDMTLERRITRSDKDITVLIFSTKQMPNDFDYSRCQTVELPHTDYEGIRISTSALRMKDGVTGVYVVIGTKVIFKSTEVLYTYGGYTVCAIPKDPAYPNRRNIAYSSGSQLSLHDLVVIDGNDIYDGMRIK